MFASAIAMIADSWLPLAFGGGVILLAAIVRGFSGFGFSLLSITALSLLLPAREIVPAIFLLEIAASINLIPSIWRDVDWRSILWLLLGYTLALPFGVAALAHGPAAPMQLALAVFVIASVALMLRGFRLAQAPGRAATGLVGAFSGLANGAFGIGGPPVVLFYFSSPAAARIGRASVIAFFLSTDLLGIAFQAREGLVTERSFAQFLVWLPALLIGIWIGATAFRRMDEARFRRIVLVILMGIALLSGAKALIDLLAS